MKNRRFNRWYKVVVDLQPLQLDLIETLELLAFDTTDVIERGFNDNDNL